MAPDWLKTLGNSLTKNVSRRRLRELLQTRHQCSKDDEIARLQNEIDHYKGVMIYVARRTIDDWARGFLESNYHYPEPPPDKGAS